MSLNIKPAPVDPAVLKARLEFLDKFESELAGSLQWNQVESAAEYRRMRREGLNGFKKPVLNPKSRTLSIDARDGHKIELRVIAPSQGQSKGVWLHFHAGQSVRSHVSVGQSVRSHVSVNVLHRSLFGFVLLLVADL
jgi:hypothetical protein